MILAAACIPPGPALAVALARAGARIVAMDPDAAALTAMANADPNRIQTLTMDSCEATALRQLNHAWADERVDLVINLMPLETLVDINRQIRCLTRLVRATARGLIRGRGAFATLVRRPADPVALAGHGLCGALDGAARGLNTAFAPRGVSFHTLTVPQQQPDVALDMLLQLTQPGRLGLRGGRIDLG